MNLKLNDYLLMEQRLFHGAEMACPDQIALLRILHQIMNEVYIGLHDVSDDIQPCKPLVILSSLRNVYEYLPTSDNEQDH